MRLITFLLCIFMLFLAWPGSAWSAESKVQTENGAEEGKDKTAGNEKAEEEKKELPPGVYKCKYYTVKLPSGWTAIMPPTDQLGTVNAIFATANGSTVVTMIIGPSGGADAQTIAEMFAEQFKAPKPPSLSNGQYVFYFPLQNSNAQAVIAVEGEEFMVTTIAGIQKEAHAFLKDAVSSEKWRSLFPK